MPEPKPTNPDAPAEKTGGEVTQGYAEQQAAKGRGFKIHDNDELITVSAEEVDEFKAKKEAGELPAKELRLPFKEAPDKKQPESTDFPKAKDEPAGDEEVIEIDEVEFLKEKGVYTDFIKSMEDVEKEIEYRRRGIIERGGYDGNERLFHRDSTADPETAVETMRKLRSLEGRLKQQKSIDSPPTEAPKKPSDDLSDEDKEKLTTGEGIAEVLMKLVDRRLGESELKKKLDKIEVNSVFTERGLNKVEFTEQIRDLVVQKPHLRKALQYLTVEEQIDLLEDVRKGSRSTAEREADKAAGRDEQRKIQLKRNANVRLKPSQATRKIEQPSDQDEQFWKELNEARRARKEGGKVKAANIVAKYGSLGKGK